MKRKMKSDATRYEYGQYGYTSELTTALEKFLESTRYGVRKDSEGLNSLKNPYRDRMTVIYTHGRLPALPGGEVLSLLITNELRMRCIN